MIILLKKIKNFFLYYFKILLYFFYNLKKRYPNSEIEKICDKLIPSFIINYNSKFTYRYKKDFIDKYLHNFFYNAISELEQKRKRQTLFPRILDIGCGFGPMALALKLHLFASRKLRKDTNDIEKMYVGIDTRDDAIDFLNNAYKDEKNFIFVKHIPQSSCKTDYIGLFNKFNKRVLSQTHFDSDGEECKYNLGFDFKADLQWSSSLFTHLTPSAVFNALEFINNNLDKQGLAINSWLILDNQSYLSMEMGLSDRGVHRYDFGSFISKSINNPLSCTIYKLEFIKESYKKAGLKIISIKRGSWRGSNRQNSYSHYQDIIISEKI